MAINSLDVQSMFSQLDKIGKEETARRELPAVQRAMAGDREARKLTENIESVNEAPENTESENTGSEELEHLRDREGRGGKDRRPTDGQNAAQSKEGAKGQPPKSADFFADPMRGKHIDIEG